MKSHREIQDSLYDFVMKELSEGEMEAVRLHLRSCPKCSEAVAELNQLVAASPRTRPRPSELLDQSYWDGLAARIEGGIARTGHGRRAHALTLRERFHLFTIPRRPAIAFAIASVAVITTATLLLRPREGVDSEEEVTAQAELIDPAARREADIAAHLRRSRNLLVGLTNRAEEGEVPVDFSVEREASRRLLADNRRYRAEVLDPHSAEVLADLERIMIEVANSRGQGPAEDLALIRQGIRQQNLLFKVRMAEQLSSRGLIVRTSGQVPKEE